MFLTEICKEANAIRKHPDSNRVVVADGSEEGAGGVEAAVVDFLLVHLHLSHLLSSSSSLLLHLPQPQQMTAEQGTALHACQHSPSSWLEGATCDRLLAAKHPDDFPVLHSHQPQLLVLSSHTEDPPLGVKRAARDFGTPQLTHRLLVLDVSHTRVCCLHVPHADASVRSASHQERARARREAAAQHPTRVRSQNLDALAVLDPPDSHCLVGRATAQDAPR
mmetsp:Transcript_36247/g.81627  ORF Transcript_36247/g.81627 Transcript_36247/m.81627 type:complete len:221 (-) Transcript_36247:438-1100(-)